MIRLLYEDIVAVQKYYPNIPDDIFMQLISLDPTYRDGSNSLGKYGKWILNLFNRGKITDNDFDEVTPLLNQFTTYRNRITNKDLNSYKTLQDLSDVLSQVIDDDSMLTPNQKNKFLKKIKSGKIKSDRSDDYDVVLDTPNFVVYVPNTHEASMNLGKGTEWCTAHENPDHYNAYTKNGYKLYIIRNKKTGERWQYSDGTDDFLDQEDLSFDIPSLMKQDKELSKFFSQFLGVDYCTFDGTYIYNGKPISRDVRPLITKIIIDKNIDEIDSYAFHNCKNLVDIIIPPNIKIIRDNAFVQCSKLTHITIPDTVEYIDFGAFSLCPKLKKVVMSNNVTEIASETFYNCYSLTNINLPDNITYIGSCAFQRCGKLKSLVIPNTVTKIGYDAFADCDNLTIYTDNEYVIDYCEDNYIEVKPLSAKNESYKKPNALKLKIRE